jgi:two-component system, chemotaxis family, chemotaxis protein CheY
VAPPILVVDDDLALAQAMTVIIANLGIPVEQCATGEVAIELMKTKRYAVVVVDVILQSGISGIYVVDAVRHMPAEERPAVLMITGASMETLRGVDRTIVTAIMLKPIDFDLFAQYVLATYRRSLNLTSEAGGVTSPRMMRVRTYCGGCGAEISPWIAEVAVLPRGASEALESWMDTPCNQCGTIPRLSAARSEWTDST